MSTTYTVKSATKTKDVTLEGKGAFQSVALILADPTGERIEAEWFTKSTTVLPVPGAQLDGTVEDGPYGKKFKKAFAPAGGGGFGRPRDPKDTAAIVRQHSQHMALLYAQAKAQAGGLPVDFTVEQLRKIIDWFDDDVRAGVTRATEIKAA